LFAEHDEVVSPQEHSEKSELRAKSDAVCPNLVTVSVVSVPSIFNSLHISAIVYLLAATKVIELHDDGSFPSIALCI